MKENFLEWNRIVLNNEAPFRQWKIYETVIKEDIESYLNSIKGSEIKKENFREFINSQLSLYQKYFIMVEYVFSLNVQGKIEFFNKYHGGAELSLTEPIYDFEKEDKRQYLNDLVEEPNMLYLIDYKNKKIILLNIVEIDDLLATCIRAVRLIVNNYPVYDVLFSHLKAIYSKYETFKSTRILATYREAPLLENQEDMVKDILNSLG